MTEPETVELICTACGEACAAEANWCEACGADLDAPVEAPKFPCVSCSAAAVEITDDGWCQMCGTKQPSPDDHVEADHGWFAMVSDIGRTHRTNEDAGAVVARASGVALIVCDGVSSTDDSQHAAQAAVSSIADTLAAAPASGVNKALIGAARNAQAAIVAVTPTATGEPPSCTMVSVVAEVDGDHVELHLGWLGDSRAYWVAADNATQLTTDHSWSTEQAELGMLSAAEIEADPRAHSITRWLGADSHDVTPEQVSVRVELPGFVLLCSDGLWNYAQDEASMHTLFVAGPDGETALERARRLVEFANTQGGHDNITVALASFETRSSHG